jgi:CelD/BcsL family acetyltransferase involved in cellulose biosynthesis
VKQPLAENGRRHGKVLEAAGVELLTTVDELEDVEEEWRRLAEQRANAFITPDWFRAAVRNEEAEPFVPLARASDGSLLGLLPLVRTTSIGQGVLRFAGADYGDFFEPVAPAAAADEAEVVAATADELSRQRDRWAVLVADYVDEGAPWVRRLSSGPDRRFALTRYHDQLSVYRSIDVRGISWEDYVGTLSRNARSQIGRKLRGLERSHDVRYRRTAQEQELEADMESFFALHEGRWGSRRQTFLASPRARAFHMDFALSALRAGWLRLWFLDVDGDSVAAWYGWLIGGRYQYYQAGFDPAWARHSPGLLLLSHTIRSAIEEGADHYDLLIGDEPYKSRFSTVGRTARTIVLTRPRHPARLVVVADVVLRRGARKLPRQLKTSLRRLSGRVLRRWPIPTAP